MSNEGKFNWTNDTIPAFSIPQCAGCVNNYWDEDDQGVFCREYGVRPQKFVDNREVCPLFRPMQKDLED